MLDLLITGGQVVDGTGREPVRADVGVRGGRVVSLGSTDEPSTSTVVADGLYVTPGFVDLHTHYDAQLAWDPAATPSVHHGVTTVFGGNCGFTLAPSGPAHADYLTRLMATVEGIPLEALEHGLTWDWSSYADWRSQFDGRLGVNAGFLVGHSAIRRAVMGEACHDPASPAQVERMATLLADALAAGGMGFSSSQAPTHHDGAGDPVPSRGADREELLALAEVVGRFPGTTLEMIVPGCLGQFSDDERQLLAGMSAVADRPLNWNVLGVSALGREQARAQVSAFDGAGGRVVALTLPQGMQLRFSLLSGVVLNGLPGWADVFKLPVPERIRAFADPAVRRRLAEGAASPDAGVLGLLARWDRFRFVETFSPATEAYAGLTVAEVAARTGAEPFDALLDVCIADELQTGFQPLMPKETDDDWAARLEFWRDPRTVVGGSDAGAHLDMMCGSTYTTALLREAVIERGLLGWGEAINLLTARPADLYGLRDRGRVSEGAHADLVLIDPERVGPLPTVTRRDLPGGAARLVAGATGIEWVFVAGEAILRDGELTGATPGTLLAAGRDTDTVAVG